MPTKHSRDRILTPPAGSLPRPRALSELLVKREKHKPVDTAEVERHIDVGVARAVKGQIDAGRDAINDGEAPRVGFSTDVVKRMRGFGGEQKRETPLDMQRYPGHADRMARPIGVAEDLARVWDTAEPQQAVHYEDSRAGVIDVANRICAAAEAAGDRERIIAGTDCGSGTFASYEFVAPDVVWAKLGAPAEGAAIASERLWR